MLQTLLTRTRGLCLLLAGTLVLEAAPLVTARAADTPKIENVRVQTSGKLVYVYYNLIGPPEQVYDVTLTLRKKAKPTELYAPKSVTGDVGPTVFNGMDWRIAWNTAREFPDGLNVQ